MLSGQAAWERNVCDAEDETAVPAGVPDRGGAGAASGGAVAEAVGGRAGLFGADAAQPWRQRCRTEESWFTLHAGMIRPGRARSTHGIRRSVVVRPLLTVTNQGALEIARTREGRALGRGACAAPTPPMRESSPSGLSVRRRGGAPVGRLPLATEVVPLVTDQVPACEQLFQREGAAPVAREPDSAGLAVHRDSDRVARARLAPVGHVDLQRRVAVD